MRRAEVHDNCFSTNAYMYTPFQKELSCHYSLDNKLDGWTSVSRRFIHYTWMPLLIQVLEKLPTAEGSANMGIQMKEEHSTTKDNFDESYGVETRNECSYDEEEEEKEPATAVSLMNLNHHITFFSAFL